MFVLEFMVHGLWTLGMESCSSFIGRAVRRVLLGTSVKSKWLHLARSYVVFSLDLMDLHESYSAVRINHDVPLEEPLHTHREQIHGRGFLQILYDIEIRPEGGSYMHLNEEVQVLVRPTLKRRLCRYLF